MPATIHGGATKGESRFLTITVAGIHPGHAELIGEQAVEGRACAEACDDGHVVDGRGCEAEQFRGIGDLLRTKILERCLAKEALEVIVWRERDRIVVRTRRAEAQERDR
jgi:hypothetical protein